MLKYTLTIALVLLSATVFAQDQSPENFQNEQDLAVNDTVKNKKGEVLQEVVINAIQKPVVQIGRAAIAPMDLPQSAQIVGSDVIKQQQSIRLSEVIKNINGVYVSSARGGAQESFYARGYDMSANNIYKNGFRVNSGSMPEVSSLEKVEVLKGGAALLYGNVTPGGILNLVTKAPSFTTGGSIEFQAGSYAFYKPSVDFYGPLSSKVAYRFIGNYENSESFRDVVARKRVYVNPSVLFKATDKTDILLQADYLYDDWTPDFGTGAIGNSVADIPRDWYLGARWSNGLTKQTTVSGLVSHRFNNFWKLDLNTSIQDYNRTSKGTERIQPNADGDWNMPLGQNKATESIFAQQVSVQGIFNTGKVKHQLMAGVDFENSATGAYTYVFDPTVYDTANIFNFYNEDIRTDIPNATISKIVITDTNRFGAYFQDLVSITEKFKVLAGLRWSWQQALPKTFGVEGAKKLDNAFSPKLGLVFQPNKDMSVFASYSNSFTPNTGVTVSGDPIEASIIDQYEVGVKKEFLNNLITANVTLYQITNSNLAQMSEFKADGTPNTDTNVKTLSGETTSKGIEVDLAARPFDGLNVIAGYSYNDMRYTETSGATGAFIEGDRLVRTPQHTANLSLFYNFAIGKVKGFSVGTIGNYIGPRLAGWNNTIGQTIPDREIPLSDYTTIDVSAGYTFRKFSILCRLSNITNVLNYTVHENYSVNPTAPRQILTSIKYKF